MSEKRDGPPAQIHGRKIKRGRVWLLLAVAAIVAHGWLLRALFDAPLPALVIAAAVMLLVLAHVWKRLSG
jgi:hypothetical protein